MVALVSPLRGPTRQKAARRKNRAAPVGMTEKAKTKRSGVEPPLVFVPDGEEKTQVQNRHLGHTRFLLLGFGVVGVGFYFFDLVGVAFAVGGD